MKLRYFNLAVLLAVIAVVAMAGFRGHRFAKPPFEIFPDMNYQPKVKDQQASAFFADGVASRPPIDGTVAEEMPAVLDYWATGKFDATHWGDGIPAHASRNGARPLEVSDADMARGRERYNITCAACHGAAGDGKGITSNYGINATSYLSDRIEKMNDGEIFNTITNGKGQMAPFGYNIAIDDRWRIIMYVRALQHAANAKLQDASPQEQQQLNDAANKKTTQNGRTFPDYQIQYLNKRTMVGWVDTYDLGGVMSNAHRSWTQAITPDERAVEIKYLNKDTVKSWRDDATSPVERSYDTRFFQDKSNAGSVGMPAGPEWMGGDW